MIGRGALNGDIVNAHPLNGGVFALLATATGSLTMRPTAPAVRCLSAQGSPSTGLQSAATADQVHAGAGQMGIGIDSIAAANITYSAAGSTDMTIAPAGDAALAKVAKGTIALGLMPAAFLVMSQRAAAQCAIRLDARGEAMWAELYEAPSGRSMALGFDHRLAVVNARNRSATLPPAARGPVLDDGRRQA